MQPSVLLVDDNPFVLYMVSKHLRQMGLIPACARDGREALARIEGQPFPLVIVELNLSLVDGVEFIRRLHQLRPQAKVIAMTGGSDDVDRAASEEGVDGMLCKPFSMDELRDSVLDVMRDVLRSTHETPEQSVSSSGP